MHRRQFLLNVWLTKNPNTDFLYLPNTLGQSFYGCPINLKKIKKVLTNVKVCSIISIVLKRKVLEKLVLMTLRVHLFPYRTQKLSSVVPKILGW